MILKALVHASISFPRRILFLWCLVACVGSMYLFDLRFETTARSFLDRHGDHWAHYQQSAELFGNDELIVVAIEAEQPFEAQRLVEVAELSRRAERLDGVRRVDSLATVPVVRGSADGALSLTPSLERRAQVSPELGAQVEHALELDRISKNVLVSADGKTFAINVFLEPDLGAERTRIQADLWTLVTKYGSPEITRISGVPVFETRVSQQTKTELSKFVPLALVLLVIVLGWSMRAGMGIVVPLLSSGIPCAMLLEVMGALGFPFTMLSMLLPSVLLALGCAYVMHLLVACRGISEPSQLEHAVLSVARPTALSGITTSLGFLAVSAAPIQAIQDMGLLGATGVFFTTAAALTLAPALLRLAPRPEHDAAWDTWIERRLAPFVMGFVWTRRRTIVGCWGAFLVIFGWGLFKLKLETDVVHWFPEDTQIRRDYDEIRERLAGVSPINIVLEARSESDTAVSPETLTRIAGLQAYLESLPEVGRAISIADPLRQLHGGFLDDPTQPVPDSAPLIAQYLLLLDSVDQIDDLLTPDHRQANILLRMDHNGSSRLLSIAEQAERWWAEHGSSEIDASATGIMFEFARSEDAITRGQLMGLMLALFAIGLILISVIRSPRTAAIALVPNAIPLVMVFGFLGLIGVPLDAGIVCLGSLALGIAVDDTTHIVLRYQDGVQRGEHPERALNHAFQSVLPAVVLSTLAVSLGFVVLGFSEFTLTRNLGLVTVAIVSACLVADATLLPALLAPPKELARSRAARPRGRRDPYLPPLFEGSTGTAEALELSAEEKDAERHGFDECDPAWMESAIAMNPGFDLSRISRSEQIALSMLDPECSYSLALDSSILRHPQRRQDWEGVRLIHRLLWPLAVLEAMRVMCKVGLYRLFHLSWAWSRQGEFRMRFLLGPRRIMSFWVDGSSPFIYALRHGVTTSAALDVLYNCTTTNERSGGLRSAFGWFWRHEPHAQGVRNRMKMVYWRLLEAMREERRRGKKDVRILSLACGSAQPVIEAVADFIAEDPEANVSLELVDLDVPSLRRAERLAYARGVHANIRLRRQNVRTFLEVDDRTWPIIEMVGFLDYRDDDSLVYTCDQIHRRLEPRGCFLTAIVCPSAWAPVVRWLANWPFLVRRSRREFKRLLERAGFHNREDVYVTDATGTFLLAYLEPCAEYQKPLQQTAPIQPKRESAT